MCVWNNCEVPNILALAGKHLVPQGTGSLGTHEDWTPRFIKDKFLRTSYKNLGNRAQTVEGLQFFKALWFAS